MNRCGRLLLAVLIVAPASGCSRSAPEDSARTKEPVSQTKLIPIDGRCSYGMAFSHDGSLLAALERVREVGGDTRPDMGKTSLIVWNRADGSVRHRSERRVMENCRLAFSPDGKRLAITFAKNLAVHNDYWLQCFDVTANRDLFERKLDFTPNGLAFAADSKEMILGDQNWKRGSAKLVRLDELGKFRSESVFPPKSIPADVENASFDIRLAPLGNVMQIGQNLYSIEPIRMLGPIWNDDLRSKIETAAKDKVPENKVESGDGPVLSLKGDAAYCVIRFPTGLGSPGPGKVWVWAGSDNRYEIKHAFAVDLTTKEVRHLGPPCYGTVSPDFKWRAQVQEFQGIMVEPYGK